MTPKSYQHPLWGFGFELPENWQAVEEGDQVTISSRDDTTASLQVRAEWNGALQPVGPIWTRHIGRLAGMFGAREVGSAPWKLNDLTGIEAEIRMPKKSGVRLWSGVLANGFIILQMVVTHPYVEKEKFNPLFTNIIAGLQFAAYTQHKGIVTEGIPLPPDTVRIDPRSIINDIDNPEQWQGYQTNHSVGALEAFFQRELRHAGWMISEFIPFPGSTLGFARFHLDKGSKKVILGVMPQGETVSNTSPGAIIIKQLGPGN